MSGPDIYSFIFILFFKVVVFFFFLHVFTHTMCVLSKREKKVTTKQQECCVYIRCASLFSLSLVQRPAGRRWRRLVASQTRLSDNIISHTGDSFLALERDNQCHAMRPSDELLVIIFERIVTISSHRWPHFQDSCNDHCIFIIYCKK